MENFTRRIIRLVYATVFIGGSLTGKERSSNCFLKVLKYGYLLSTFVIYIGMFSLLGVTIFHRSGRSEDFIRPLVLCLPLMNSFVLAIMGSYNYPRSLPLLEQSLHDYETRYGLGDYANNMPKRAKIILILVGVTQIGAPPITIIALMNLPLMFCDVYLSCYLGSMCFVGVLVVSLCIVVSYVALLTGVTVCFIFMYILWKEFCRLKKTFQQLVSLRYHVEKTFDNLTKQHEELSNVLATANDTFGHYDLMTVIVVIPTFCATFYVCLVRQQNPWEIIYMMWSMSICLLVTGFKLFTAALISLKAHACLRDAWKINKAELSERGLYKLNLFVRRLALNDICYNVYGLLNINMSTLLVIFGTVVAYVIVVIQFAPGETPSCKHVNMTCCVS